MKNNRKNRKLKAIKIKNNLRLGITKFYLIDKVSHLLKENSLSEEYIKKLVNNAQQSLLKHYNLKLNKIKIDLLAYEADDFIKDTHTNRIVLSRGNGCTISNYNQ